MANPVVDLEGAEFTFTEGDPATVVQKSYATATTRWL